MMIDIENRRTYQRIYQRKYYRNNKEKVLGYIRKYNENNREKILKRYKDYYLKNCEKRKESVYKYRRKNKEKVKEGWKMWYLKNKVKFAEKNKKYRETHPEYFHNHRTKHRMEIISILGIMCANCGFDDIRALQVDHVNGGGSIHRRNSKSSIYYKEILEEIKSGSKKYQILCANCNQIKKYTHREYNKNSRIIS